MDEFAQTRGDDDLFDDEVIPISSQPELVSVPEPEPEQEPETYTSTPQQQEAQVQEPVPPQIAQDQRQEQPPAAQNRRRGNGRGRGRGNGRAGKARPVEPPSQIEQQTEGDVSADGNQTQQPDNEEPPSGNDNGEDVSAEDKAKEAATPKVPAVRGDRSGTGGVRKVSIILAPSFAHR